MKRDRFFSTSKYFRTTDIPPEGLTLTIHDCTAEVLGRQQREVPVLSFEEEPRKFVLNHTNWATLARSYGDDSDEWIGRPVVLEVVDVTFEGNVVPGMRVRVPEMAPADDESDAERNGGADDEVPF